MIILRASAHTCSIARRSGRSTSDKIDNDGSNSSFSPGAFPGSFSKQAKQGFVFRDHNRRARTYGLRTGAAT